MIRSVLCLICHGFLAVFVFSSQVLYSQEQKEPPPLTMELVNQITFPEDVGIVKEVYIPNKERIERLVVYFQDAHCNYEAQMNISKMIRTLIEDFGFELVNVEGTAGIIDTRPFSTFKDRKVKLDFAEYFMKQGKITGPEYLSITSDLDFIIYGIEDEDLYAENYTAYMNALEYRDRVNAYTKNLLQRLNKLKDHMFNETLLELDRVARRYEDKRMDFGDYTKFLEDFAEQHDIDVSRFENFILQAKARAIEDNIDFKQVEEQRSRLIDTFHAELKDSKDEIKAIVQKSLAFRLREITAEDYYHFLVKAARDNGIDLDRFPLVLEYAKYLSFYYKMDKSKIIDEIAQLETYIKKELYQNDVEAELDYLAKVMSVLKRLFRLEVIKADYEFFLNNKADFNFRATKDFILEHGKQYGVYLGFDVNYQVVEDNLHWVLDFYDAALRRDRVLLENAVKQMEDRGEDRFALITGGFHSDGLTNQMKEKNIPYILVAPRILDPTADTPYEDVMRAQADSVRGYRGIVE